MTRVSRRFPDPLPTAVTCLADGAVQAQSWCSPGRGRIHDDRGFTLIELMVVAICIGLLLGPLWRVFTAGTATSLRGILHAETVREGRTILRQIQDDLRHACIEFTGAAIELDVNKVVERGGTPPLQTFRLLSFPRQGPISGGAVPTTTSGNAFRRASEIRYRLEAGRDARHPFHRLSRVERYHPDHPMASEFPGGEKVTVLSERVNYFDIQPFTETAGGRSVGCFWVTLQLADAVAAHALPPVAAGSRRSDGDASTLIADFYTVVVPQFFNDLEHREGYNPNWHTGVVGPPAAAP